MTGVQTCALPICEVKSTASSDKAGTGSTNNTDKMKIRAGKGKPPKPPKDAKGKPPKPPKPAKINKLSVSQKSGNKRVYLTFRWSKSGNAEKYGIYLKKNGKWKQIDTTGKNSFKYTVKPLKKYTFGVRGIRGENMGKLKTIKFKTVEAAIPY